MCRCECMGMIVFYMTQCAHMDSPSTLSPFFSNLVACAVGLINLSAPGKQLTDPSKRFEPRKSVRLSDLQPGVHCPRHYRRLTIAPIIAPAGPNLPRLHLGSNGPLQSNRRRACARRAASRHFPPKRSELCSRTCLFVTFCHTCCSCGSCGCVKLRQDPSFDLQSFGCNPESLGSHISIESPGNPLPNCSDVGPHGTGGTVTDANLGHVSFATGAGCADEFQCGGRPIVRERRTF